MVYPCASWITCCLRRFDSFSKVGYSSVWIHVPTSVDDVSVFRHSDNISLRKGKKNKTKELSFLPPREFSGYFPAVSCWDKAKTVIRSSTEDFENLKASIEGLKSQFQTVNCLNMLLRIEVTVLWDQEEGFFVCVKSCIQLPCFMNSRAEGKKGE